MDSAYASHFKRKQANGSDTIKRSFEKREHDTSSCRGSLVSFSWTLQDNRNETGVTFLESSAPMLPKKIKCIVPGASCFRIPAASPHTCIFRTTFTSQESTLEIPTICAKSHGKISPLHDDDLELHPKPKVLHDNSESPKQTPHPFESNNSIHLLAGAPPCCDFKIRHDYVVLSPPRRSTSDLELFPLLMSYRTHRTSETSRNEDSGRNL